MRIDDRVLIIMRAHPAGAGRVISGLNISTHPGIDFGIVRQINSRLNFPP